MSTSSTRDTAHETDRGLFTFVSLLSMAVFFVGCGCFTLAVILLGSNDTVSAVLGIIGVPLFIVGGAASFWRAASG